MINPLLIQIQNRYYSVDCGMSYVLRLDDGRFVVIDGGYDEAEEAEHLYDVLCKQNVLAGSPVIAAWFFTHPHRDHFGCFTDVCEKFSDRLNIERVLYNFPTTETCTVATDDPLLDCIKHSLKNTACLHPVRGQRFRFGNAVFDVLMTHLDMEHPIPNLNDSSMILRTDIAGHRILWLGDAQSLESDRLCELYTKDELKCDILQVGHHGYGGGSQTLYRTANPKTLLWPVPDFTYHWVKDWDCNEFLMNSDAVERCYLSGREETVIDLTAAFPSPVTPTATANEIVLKEQFSNTNLYKLGWCCITGGSVPYRPAEIKLGNGFCTLTAQEAYTVCEFLQPHKLYRTNGYALSLECSVSGTEGNFGLLWNDDTPMKRDVNRAWWLSLPSDRTVNIQLTANGQNETATLRVDNELIETVPYAPTEQHGLYFVLQNITLTVNSITVTAL